MQVLWKPDHDFPFKPGTRTDASYEVHAELLELFGSYEEDGEPIVAYAAMAYFYRRFGKDMTLQQIYEEYQHFSDMGSDREMYERFESAVRSYLW